MLSPRTHDPGFPYELFCRSCRNPSIVLQLNNYDARSIYTDVTSGGKFLIVDAFDHISLKPFLHRDEVGGVGCLAQYRIRDVRRCPAYHIDHVCWFRILLCVRLNEGLGARSLPGVFQGVGNDRRRRRAEQSRGFDVLYKLHESFADIGVAHNQGLLQYRESGSSSRP